MIADPVFDSSHLASMLGTDDRVICAEVYELFLAQIETLAETVNEQRQSGDLASLRDLTHRLKSSAQSVGAFALARQLAYINTLAECGDDQGIEDAVADFASLVDATRTVLKAAVISLPN
jgi:HPt (histidine-containing phosphotransfer) domain-containing protein